jgi:hypothetical protein
MANHVLAVILGGKPLKKKGRPRSENPMVHTAVVLPRDMLEELRRDAAEHNQGVSAEIRLVLRANQLLKWGRIDFETGGLTEAIKLLAQFLARDLGKEWHEHPYVLAAFKAGVASFLMRYHPQGDENARPGWIAGEPNDPPDVVGRTHARRIRIGHHIDEDDNEPPDDDDYGMRDLP